MPKLSLVFHTVLFLDRQLDLSPEKLALTRVGILSGDIQGYRIILVQAGGVQLESQPNLAANVLRGHWDTCRASERLTFASKFSCVLSV